MPLLSGQRGPIALYGATGYTGKLVAAELAAAKADFVLVGARPRRSSRPSPASSSGSPAGPTPPRSTTPTVSAALLGDCAVVIDCAGPFTSPRRARPPRRGGDRHPLPRHHRRAALHADGLERYGPEAERRRDGRDPGDGLRLRPGRHDRLAHSEGHGRGRRGRARLRRERIHLHRVQSDARDDALALEILRGGEVEWRKLQWLPARDDSGAGSFDFGDPIGRQRMARYPAGEQITVPRHIATRRVQDVDHRRHDLAPSPGLDSCAVDRPAGPRHAHPARKRVSGR